MANESTVKINVTSEGTIDAEIAKAKELAMLLKQAQKARQSLAGDTPTRSKALEAAQAPRGATGLARSIGADSGTGSGARDFARQAAGLGGVVRLYATFAANIFAVTAAFGALSRAADTTNLIRGLDQLGASAGRNLGGLSKQFALATDNAISLRDASTAVAKASSSGLGAENILRIAGVAKTASQALGVDMADAVSRLTRGITKLEPELLDEIGIFTRVDKAVQDYAKSVGKSTLSLTDFERRQAFANAVLEEGEKKFSAIKLDANPYSKLAAALQDVTFKGLEFVNIFLTPVIKLLSQSPVALGAAILGVAGILLKQAIPAIGQVREQLKLNAQAAIDTSRKFRESFDDNFQAKLAARFKIPDLNKDLLKAEATLANIRRAPAAVLPASINLNTNKSVSSILGGAGDEAAVKRVNTQIRDREKLLEKNILRGKELSQADRTRVTAEIDGLTKVIEKYKAEAAAVNAVATAKRNLAAADTAIENRANQPIGILDPERIAERKASRLEGRATRSTIVSNVAENTAILGIRDSMALLNKEIADKGVTGWNKWSTVAKGGLVSVATRIGGIIGAFGYVGFVIAGIAAGFQLLDSVFSRNKAQAEKFTQSIEGLESSVKNVVATLDLIADKDPFQRVSVESTQARANAMLDLSDAISLTVKSFEKVERAAGVWDNFVDGIFDLFGKGNFDKLSASFSDGIVSAIKSMQEGPAKEAALKKIATTLNIDTSKLNIAGIEQALGRLSEEKALSLIKQTAPELRKITTEYNISAAAGTRYAESLKATAKIISENTASLKAQDIDSKLGDQLIDQSRALAEALGDPVQELTLLVRTAEDIQSLSLLPRNTALELSNAREETKSLIVEYTSLRDKLKEVSDARAAAEKKFDSRRSSTADKDELNRLKVLEEGLSRSLNISTKKLTEESGKAAQLVTQKFIAGVELLYLGLEKARKRAQLDFDKSFLGAQQALGLSNAEEDIRIRKEEIRLTLSDLEAKFRNTVAVERLTSAISLQTASDNKKLAGPDTIKQAEEAEVLAKRIDELANLPFDQLLKAYRQSVGKDSGGTVSLDAKALRALGNLITAGIGTQGATAQARSQLRFLDTVGGEQSRGAQDLSDDQKRNDLISIRAQLLANTSKTYSEIAGITSEQLIKEREENEIALSVNKNRREIAEVSSRLDRASKLTGPKGTRDLELENLRNEKTLLEERAEQEKQLIKLRAILDINLDRADKQIKLAEKELSVQEEVRNFKLATIELDRNRLEFLDQLGVKGIQFADAELSRLSEQIELETKLGKIRQAKLAETAPISARIESVRALPATKQNISNISILEAERSAVEARYASEERSLNIIYELKNKQNAQTTAYKQSLLDISNISEALSGTFGKLGESFGSIAVAILNASTVSKMFTEEALANTEKQRLAQIALNAAQTDEDITASRKALNKAESDGVKIKNKAIDAQLDGYSSILSAIKKNAGEQSRTAQVVSKIEKAIHIAKLAMWAKEQIAVLTNSATTISAALAAAGANSLKAITAAFAAPFPVGFVAGAAMIAIMSSLLGGRSKSPPVNFSAESQQAVQGTGQTYNNEGKLVSRGGGALGDDSAIAKSIDTSISKVEQNTFNTLEYSNKMLDNLKGIKNNTEGLTALLLQSGFNIKGSAENSVTGEYRTGPGVAGLLVNAIFGKDSGIGRAVGKLTSKIFGGKTTTEVQDTGIAISGTLEALSMGAAGLAQQYTNIKQVVDGGWFKRDKTSYTVMTENLSEAANRFIGDTFSTIKDTVLSASDALGKDSDIVKAIVDNFNIAVKVSALGLKPDELAEAITAELSVAFNQVSEKAFPELQQFRKSGEEMGATVVRLARNMELTSLALETVNINFARSGDTAARVGANERLIDLSGGVEEFLSKTEFFKDNFLSQAEQLVPVQRRVVAEMSRLGFSSVDTRKEFKELVQSLDLSSESGQTTYAALMNVAEGFAEVYPELQKTISAEERRLALIDQQIQIYRLEGSVAKATLLEREQQLSKLDDSLKAGQLYIYALQDEAALKSELKTAYDKESSAIKNTISNLTGYIKSLQNFSTSLVTGGLSNLTAQDKYAELQKQTQDTIALINKTAVTEDEKSARAEAINSLPTIGSSFLEASRTLFASSDKYNEDFSLIQKIIAETTSTLVSEKSVSELQLQALDTNTTILQVIKDNTRTTTDILNSILIAQQSTSITGALASNSGLIAAGTTNITEPTDITSLFKSFVDSYISTAEQQKVVEAIATLTKEVVTMREELALVSGDAVMANAASNDKNAEDISVALETIVNQRTWRDTRNVFNVQ